MTNEERDKVWRDGYEFGRAEADWEHARNGVAGAPIVQMSVPEDEDEAFWTYHLGRVEEGHYEEDNV